MQNDNINYDFQAITNRDYILKIIFTVENKLFVRIFEVSKLSYKRKKGIKVEGNLENIQEFPLAEEYYNYCSVVLRPTIARIRKIVNKDNIEILSHKVTKGVYKRNDNLWNIIFEVTGEYINKK